MIYDSFRQKFVELFPEFTLEFTVCPKSLCLIYIGTYYINWVKTSWTYSIVINTLRSSLNLNLNKCLSTEFKND